MLKFHWFRSGLSIKRSKCEHGNSLEVRIGIHDILNNNQFDKLTQIADIIVLQTVDGVRFI